MAGFAIRNFPEQINRGWSERTMEVGSSYQEIISN
jgi:hypothetical protein